MYRTAKLLVPALMILSAACYHAIVDTGLTPSTQVIDKPWASGWIFGIVPPSPIATMAQCPRGVAKVETQLSFVNQVVNILTLGIYTPMAIKVTCAEGGRSSIPADASKIDIGLTPTPADKEDAVIRAVTLSLETGAPVYLELDTP